MLTRLGKAPCEQHLRIPVLANGGVIEDGRLAGEDPREEPLAAPSELTLGERPQREVVHLPWQRVAHGMYAQEVRRTGDQELAWDSVSVHPRLDREQQLGCALNLVDHRTPPARRDESGGSPDASVRTGSSSSER